MLPRSLQPVLARLIAAIASLCVVLWTAGFAEDERSPSRRALPPNWSRDVLDTFFQDARDQLDGDRPDYSALAGSGRAVLQGPGDSGARRTRDAGTDGFRWSTLIRPETLEDEVKRVGRLLAENVETPSQFKGGGYRACRRDLSLLAGLFAVIGEYDASVRWRDEAPAYRELFARAGFNCKVGTDQSFREAQLRSEDLQSIIRGRRIGLPEAEREAVWPQVADRAPLMHRMEVAYEERLSKWLTSPGEFRGNLAEIRHDAELLAVLAEVIAHEGYEYADDAEYARYAADVRNGAREIAEAAASEDYERASEADANIGQACADCHEGFRT